MSSIYVVRGQTKRLQLKFFQGAANASDPVDLTGHTLSVRDQKNIRGEVSFTATDAAQGECLLVLTDAQTSAMKDGRNNYVQVQTTAPNGDVMVYPRFWLEPTA